MNEYYVYAMQSEMNERINVGISNDPGKRLKEHNQGRTQSTNAFGPWKIFFIKKVINRNDARDLEKYYKGGSGKEKLKQILSKQLPL